MDSGQHDFNALFDLARRGRVTALEEAWSDRFDVDAPGPTGHTLLMTACNAGQGESVRWLLERGANPNLATAKGTTPLMYAKTAAFGSGDPMILDLLISAGADVKATDKAGLTALDYTRQRAAFLIDYLSSKESTA